MNLTLEQLGLDAEKLQDLIVERAVERLLVGRFYDEDGEPIPAESQLRQQLDVAIRKRVEETINALAEKHVLPNVSDYIEGLTLQTTNEWGQKRGEPVTFVEYLVQRAQAYMQEKVNFEGKGQAECNGYSFTGTQTRITHLMHKHLHFSIETAMKNALQVANSAIAQGIAETVKVKLAEVVAGLKTTVATK